MAEPIGMKPMELLALVVCERLDEDEVSKQWSLIRLRDEFVADKYPFVMRHGRIYFAYTGVRQVRIDLIIRLVDADDGVQVRYAEVAMTGVTPVGNGAANIPLDGATVPKPGIYFAEAIANGHLIGRRRIEFKLQGQTDGTEGSQVP